MFTTVLNVPGLGEAKVTTVDFQQPGYEVCGFESVTTFFDGFSFGIGPDNGESPSELHDIAVEQLQQYIDGEFGDPKLIGEEAEKMHGS
jgi:hypothetical protein